MSQLDICAINLLPKVSVIIPAYNHAGYIVEAVQSVLGQSYSDLEVIVVDDGSQDDTLEKLEKIRDERLRVYSQTNQGAHSAIGRGLALAKAEWLAILNSDDVYEPTRIERLLDVVANRQLAFAFTAVRLIDAESRIMDDPSHPWLQMMEQYIGVWRKTGSLVDALLIGNVAATTSNFFFSRSLYEKLGPLRPLKYVHDWDYVLRAAIAVPEAVVWLNNEALLKYRLHGANTILGGAVRNHLEAARLVARGLELRYGESLHRPLVRLNYLRRFVRKFEAHTLNRRIGEIVVERDRNATELEWYRQRRDELDVQVRDLLGVVDKLSSQNSKLHEHITSLHEQINIRQHHLNEIYSSRLWRWSEPLRQAARWRQRFRGFLKVLPNRLAYLRNIAAHRGLIAMLRVLFRRLQDGAAENQLHSTTAAAVFKQALEGYQAYVAAEKKRVESIKPEIPVKLAALSRQPLLSIVVPVYNPSESMLRSMLESVRNQFYPNWQLCIVDDASTRSYVSSVLAEYAKMDGRIEVVRRSENGHIVRATNDAIRMARGEYVLFLDHDDELAPHALLRLAEYVDEHSDAEAIYTDEDKISLDGRRSLPYFKPDWSPALAYSHNYICHLLCCRRTVLEKIGYLREGFEGSQDYDLILRLAASVSKFHHLPEVLYHWRQHDESTASNADSKPYAHEAGRNALSEHLRARYGERFRFVENGVNMFTYTPRFTASASRVSIVIPTRDKADLLRQCIDSILQKTTWENYEVLILDNNSSESSTHACFKEMQEQDARIRVIPAFIEFNWSKLNNLGVAQATGDVFVFLNNDTEIITADWLERLVEVVTLPDVATAGPLLLYEDGTIQHAGVVVGMGGWADHVFKGQPVQHLPTPWVSSMVSRDVLALTGACVAIAREKWQCIGGFDESFVICGSDVELGIRAHHAGLRNVYLPEVRLYHYESKSRGQSVDPEDFVQSDIKYAPYRLQGDPFFNPNLSLSHTTPTVLVP